MGMFLSKLRKAVVQELDGPGMLFGYRAMTQTLPKVQSKGPKRFSAYIMFDCSLLVATAPSVKKSKSIVDSISVILV